VCEPECPVDAIIADSVDGVERWLELNRWLAGGWPNITRKSAPPQTPINSGAEPDKFKILLREAGGEEA